MSTIRPRITFICPEQWDKMKVGMLSRYCESCSRDVIDFTKMSREQVLRNLLANRNNKVCGRIYRSQLDYHHSEILMTVDRYLKTSKSSNLSFYLLSLSALLTVGCAEDNGKFKMATEIVAKEDGDEKKFDSYDPSDSVWSQEVTILGEIVAVDSLGYDSIPPTDVRIFAEVMPEFPGGMHALMKYISENVEYPKGETVPGTVFVEFVVNTDGSLSDIKIIKSSDSQAFDKEVIKMIEAMPPWKPGMEGGVNVRVKYVVPVRVRWG